MKLDPHSIRKSNTKQALIIVSMSKSIMNQEFQNKLNDVARCEERHNNEIQYKTNG